MCGLLTCLSPWANSAPTAGSPPPNQPPENSWNDRIITLGAVGSLCLVAGFVGLIFLSTANLLTGLFVVCIAGGSALLLALLAQCCAPPRTGNGVVPYPPSSSAAHGALGGPVNVGGASTSGSTDAARATAALRSAIFQYGAELINLQCPIPELTPQENAVVVDLHERLPGTVELGLPPIAIAYFLYSLFMPPTASETLEETPPKIQFMNQLLTEDIWNNIFNSAQSETYEINVSSLQPLRQYLNHEANASMRYLFLLHQICTSDPENCTVDPARARELADKWLSPIISNGFSRNDLVDAKIAFLIQHADAIFRDDNYSSSDGEDSRGDDAAETSMNSQPTTGERQHSSISRMLMAILPWS